MIDATITSQGRSVRLRWTPAGVELDGDAELRDRIARDLQPGAWDAYNPRLGGLYEGCDAKDPLQVVDALHRLGRWATITLALLELPPGPASPVPWASEDGKDWSDPGTYRASLPNAYVARYGQPEDVPE